MAFPECDDSLEPLKLFVVSAIIRDRSCQSWKSYVRQLHLVYTSTRLVTYAFPFLLQTLFIQPLILYRFLITVHYLRTHSSGTVSRFYKNIPLPPPATPPFSFELDAIRLFLKGCQVLCKPVRRLSHPLSFPILILILFIAESLATTPYLRAHFITLLLQVRWVMRFGKLVAPRIRDTKLHFRDLDPDDDRIRLSQLFIDDNPFPSLSNELQQFVIKKFISGNVPFRAAFHLNTKTSRCRFKRILEIFPEDVSNPFCLPKYLGYQLFDLISTTNINSKTTFLSFRRDRRSHAPRVPVTTKTYIDWFRYICFLANCPSYVPPGTIKKTCLTEMALHPGINRVSRHRAGDHKDQYTGNYSTLLVTYPLVRR